MEITSVRDLSGATNEDVWAEIERLNAERDAARREVERLTVALDLAGKDFAEGHIHIAERLSETDYRWLMHHLEESFGRVCDALFSESPS